MCPLFFWRFAIGEKVAYWFYLIDLKRIVSRNGEVELISFSRSLRSFCPFCASNVFSIAKTEMFRLHFRHGVNLLKGGGVENVEDYSESGFDHFYGMTYPLFFWRFAIGQKVAYWFYLIDLKRIVSLNEEV